MLSHKNKLISTLWLWKMKLYFLINSLKTKTEVQMFVHSAQHHVSVKTKHRRVDDLSDDLRPSTGQ